MDEIKAFVGHSFTPDDEQVVRSFLDYFDQLTKLHPSFSWEHARAAAPAELRVKVLSLLEGKNTFVAICTRKERIIASEALSPTLLNRDILKAPAEKFGWKTSDWVIQEIGLAVGRDMKIIILLEEGCREPGGLQGNTEYIAFRRDQPHRAFGRIVEMITALSPSTGNAGAGGVSGKATVATPEGSEATTTDVVFENPGVDWDADKYRSAAVMLILHNEPEKLVELHNVFLTTPHGQERQKAAEWESTIEWYKIILYRGGSLEKLRKLAEEFPKNSEILRDLADALGEFELYAESAHTFQRASETSPDKSKRVSRLGQSALQFAKAGDQVRAREWLDRQKAEAGSDSELRKSVLSAIKDIAAQNKDDELEIEALEREVELAPDDFEARFQLAYKHGEAGNEDVALYHYLKIPAQSRTPIGWNNLGVSYQHFRAPSRAVAAYRRAASEGDTLAMSNLAYKLMNAGFTDEAKAEALKAMAIEGHHSNIEACLAALTEMDGNEKTSIDDALAKVKRKVGFYAELGRALAESDFIPGTTVWRGPVCELTVVVNGAEFVAAGSYDRPANALLGLGGAFGARSVREQILYKGRIIGNRIDGTIKRWDEGSKVTPSLFSDLMGETRVLMVASTSKIQVMENPASSSPSFYELLPA